MEENTRDGKEKLSGKGGGKNKIFTEWRKKRWNRELMWEGRRERGYLLSAEKKLEDNTRDGKENSSG